ncbi:hypothetical protein [Segniliparus rotundus]|uniref:hypothetical protein n=1 Tax=Segniliparus rotundus TaxID=286802 RepID=UPI00059E0C80|nr:hypothetical protein [Segniliparus rotundus]
MVLRLPRRDFPKLIEERARVLNEAMRLFLSAYDDECSEAVTDEEREWCRNTRRYMDDWFGDVLSEVEQYAFPDAEDIEADRACDLAREVA